VQTKVSSKGQVVLPISIRNKLRIREGDPLEVHIENERVILVPTKPKKRKGRIIKDPLTGMAVLTFGPGAPVITNEMVAKLLEDFP
jgi:AbrB family looped-hinge helix DNA binding protein